jgi:hypothetical protein
MAPKTKTAASEAVTAAGEVEMKPVSGGYADVNAVNAVSRDLRRGRTPGADPWRADDDRRHAGMGAAADEDEAGNRGGDAG